MWSRTSGVGFRRRAGLVSRWVICSVAVLPLCFASMGEVSRSLLEPGSPAAQVKAAPSAAFEPTWTSRQMHDQSAGLSEPEWIAFQEWSGESGHRQTERFTTSRERWRVSWKMTSGDPFGSLSISVRNADDDIVALAVNLQGGIDRKGLKPGSLEVHSAPGEHYLQIDSIDLDWHVVAEHQP